MLACYNDHNYIYTSDWCIIWSSFPPYDHSHTIPIYGSITHPHTSYNSCQIGSPLSSTPLAPPLSGCFTWSQAWLGFWGTNYMFIGILSTSSSLGVSLALITSTWGCSQPPSSVSQFLNLDMHIHARQSNVSWYHSYPSKCLIIGDGASHLS